MKAFLRALDGVFIICRRELAATLYAPIAYVVSVLFLALQGFSFWAVVSVLSDPAQPAPPGAALRSHFGGTFVHWTVLVVLVCVISMRLVAEEKRQGTWESLCTAPVSEGAIIAGKWLGGLGFYALLWLPTLLYPAILHHYAPPGAVIEIGPIASAYAGVLLIGMAFLAIGVAASAATANQIIAAVITFFAAMGLILVADVPELMPGSPAWHPAIAVAEQIAVRVHMEAFARGLIPSPALVFCVGVVVMSLTFATLAAVWGRRRRREVRSRLLAGGLVTVIVVCINILAYRHPVRWDVTAARVNSLDPRTERVLADAAAAFFRDNEPLRVWVVRAGLDVFAQVQAEVDRLLQRMVAGRPGLALLRLDPAAEPERLATLAAEFAIPMANLRDGGVVVLQRGARRRAVDLLDMAGFAEDDLGVGKLARFAAEEALVTAMSELLDPDRPTICHTVGHGELALAAEPDNGPGNIETAVPAPAWSGLSRRITRDGGLLYPVDALAAGVPGHCRALIIAGPTRALSAREAAAVDTYLAQGGRLLLALSEAVDATSVPGGEPGFTDTGLAVVLADYGVAIPRVAVFDPAAAVDGPASWFTTEGYGEHPISASFRGRRLTLWRHPRAVLLAAAAHKDPSLRASVLVESSPEGWGEGWGEIDLGAVHIDRSRRGPGAIAGPVSIAVAVERPATGARLVVIGGAHALAADMTRGSAGELFAWASLAWLSGRRHGVDIGAKTPEHVRLIMSSSQLRRVLWLCVAILPGFFAALGAVIAWRRRRAAA